MLPLSFPGWTIPEAIERTSDPDVSVDILENEPAVSDHRAAALRERLARAELVLTGSFASPTALLGPIEPRNLLELNWSPSSSLIAGVEVFNVRVFPVLNAPNADAYLDNLSLTDAFRRYVLNDPEVVALAKRLSLTGKAESAVLVDGQTPGASVDYHWPLDATTASLEYRFVDTPLIFIGDPARNPSALISKVSEALASRLAGLRQLLQSGRVSAFGTYVLTGLEVPIACQQWSREDVSIDVRNGDLCEGQDYWAKPKWTGVSFRVTEALQSANQTAAEPTKVVAKLTSKATAQIQTKEKSRLECIVWLEAMMSDERIVPRSKEDLWAEAQLKWPKKLTQRAFFGARDDAIADTEAWAWKAPGPKPKSSHS